MRGILESTEVPHHYAVLINHCTLFLLEYFAIEAIVMRYGYALGGITLV